ncbi:MAG: DUF1413 domain-containing protein [Desulfobacteraceae bacterium]|nr:DUF1413 domain-containing protein [Desulfobacteraceae bacterium]
MSPEDRTEIERHLDLINVKIDLKEIGNRFGLKDLFGDDWGRINSPTKFGTTFAEAYDEGYFEKLNFVGIKRSGRYNEYERIK